MNLVRLAEPYNVGELILLQSLLEGSGIAYSDSPCQYQQSVSGSARSHFSCDG